MSLSAKTNIAYQQVESPLLMANRVMIDNAGDISFVNDEGEATTINGTSIDTLHINTESASIKNLAVENFEVSNENITGSVVILTESWTDGTNWYRKYSDGMIEQWGTLETTNTANERAISLPTAFSNTYYHAIGVLTNGGLGYAGVLEKTTTGFKVSTRSSSSSQDGDVSWYACGY